MITVTYHANLNRVVVEGHAGFAEAGKDLVCASATILAYTLAAFVDAKEQEGKCWCTMCHFNEGEAFVSCKANEGNEGEIAVGFETIVRGFELLAEKFPDNVKYISLRAKNKINRKEGRHYDRKDVAHKSRNRKKGLGNI